jgi:hypothetical protein
MRGPIVAVLALLSNPSAKTARRNFHADFIRLSEIPRNSRTGVEPQIFAEIFDFPLALWTSCRGMPNQTSALHNPLMPVDLSPNSGLIQTSFLSHCSNAAAAYMRIAGSLAASTARTTFSQPSCRAIHCA